ncbi:MAG: YigZ family protein [Saprospiraceae bacterium]
MQNIYFNPIHADIPRSVFGTVAAPCIFVYLPTMAELPDFYHTIEAPSEGLFKDRGSKFFGYAFPAKSEEEALELLEQVRKEHFKARHHCYAWRFGLEGTRFRANDDGEPSGTAGRPILGQIDSKGLTDVFVVVVRYFGGTLLGASGLIQAYRTAAAEALDTADIVEKFLYDSVLFELDYALVPELMNSLKKLQIALLNEEYGALARMELGIRRNSVESTLLDLKALVHKVSREEAQTLDWPEGIRIVTEEAADDSN